MKLLKNNKSWLIALAILFIYTCIYGRLFITRLIGAHDLPYIYHDQLIKALSRPQAWITRYGNSFGSDNITTLWLYPFDVIGGVLASIGISYGIFIKFFGVAASVIFGFAGIWLLLREQNISDKSKVVGALFYTINTYFLLLIDGGQIQIALAYGLLPISIYAFMRSIDSTILSKAKLGLILCLLDFADVRFLYIFLIVATVFSLVHIRQLGKIFQSGLIAGVIFILLNFYWIYPLLMYRVITLPSSYTEAANFGALSFATFWHSFELLTPHWYLNVFGKISPILPILFIAPFLAFWAPVFMKKNKSVAMYLILAMVGIFLSKGAGDPFQSINIFIFRHIPGMSLFRDPTKFYFLTALCYSVLVSITTDNILKKNQRLFTLLLTVAIGIYLSVIVLPIMRGKLTGLLSEPANVYENNQISESIQMENVWGRTLWIPNRLQLGYSSPVHPSIDMDITNQIRPFISQSVGSYEINNFLREGKYTGELLSMSGIRMIAYPSLDSRRDSTKPEDVAYHNDFWNQIKNRPWVESVGENKVLTVKNAQQQIFALNNLLYVLGPDTFYDELSARDSRVIGAVFLEQMPGLAQKVSNDSLPILGYQKNKMDLLGSLIPDQYQISPSIYLQNDPDSSGWWKRTNAQFREARTFLQDKYSIDMSDFDYGKGWAFSEGENAMILPEEMKSGHLFVRALFSSEGGILDFVENNNSHPISTLTSDQRTRTVPLTNVNGTVINHSYESAVFHWIEVGEIKNGKLTIKTKGILNVITSIAVIPDDVYINIQKSVQDSNFTDWGSLSDKQKDDLIRVSTKAHISIMKDLPTEKEFTVTNADTPIFIGFSNTYSSLWKMNEQEPLPLFTFLNSYRVPGNGTYNLRYEPQKEVDRGFVVSVISILVLLTYIVWAKK